MRNAAVLLALCACGHRAATAPAAEKKDGGAPADAASVVELAPLSLGLPTISGFDWRKRDGHPAFREARKAERRGDWPAVVKDCQRALAADPGHLEAAWLLAVGLAKTGKLDEVLAPLTTAVAGDFGKWGQASLELPALQPWLATPTGQAWRRRIDDDRKQLASRLGSALIVVAHGDLYAGDDARWYRLTRTYGTVLGGLPGAHEVAYVTRKGVGIVDLERVKTSRPVPVGTPPVLVAENGADVWVGRPWKKLDTDGKLHALPAKTKPPATYLELLGKTAQLHRVPKDIIADWDDHMFASAMRLGTSGRAVSAPSPGLIDGSSIAWAPDRAHLAFVAIDDHCTPGSAAAAAFVVDATTGTLTELERATGGISLAWRSEKKLAVAGDHGVSIVELGGATTSVASPGSAAARSTAAGGAELIDGATGLLEPRRKPRCAPELPDSADTPPADDDSADEPSDAGVP